MVIKRNISYSRRHPILPRLGVDVFLPDVDSLRRTQCMQWGCTSWQQQELILKGTIHRGDISQWHEDGLVDHSINLSISVSRQLDTALLQLLQILIRTSETHSQAGLVSRPNRKCIDIWVSVMITCTQITAMY